MKFQIFLLLAVVAAAALARPSDIVDFETDKMEVEQEGQPGKAVEGEYSFVAPNGEEVYVKYVADHLGFRVLESDNTLPEVDEAEEAEEDEEGDEE